MITRSLQDAADWLFNRCGQELSLATPLGLGKPNQLLNIIYDRVAADPKRSLTIYTALSLEPPHVKGELAQRFFAPFAERHWGKDYPSLRYFQDAVREKLPSNISVHEFYFQAGAALGSPTLQQDYQSVNYTHVAENVLRADIDAIVQLIATKKENGKTRYSLSCNPDLTLDVVELYKNAGKRLCVIGVVHPDLPFIAGEAEVDEDFFSMVVESGEVQHQLFALPRMPISPEDHLIGFYASLLVEDEGTLQIGIGSLSDALAHSLRLREQDNQAYIELAQKFPSAIQNTSRLSKGLYGLTEMLTDGFMHLRAAGILKREVVDELSGNKTYVHGSFILGSKVFYQWLRDLKGEDASGLRMTRVSKVNDLYDPNETRLRQQRIRARFFNTTMQVSLLGEAASETLSDARVVSGVGGQYNFVAMSHELKGARSVLMLRSVRIDERGRRSSNILWQLGHPTIPRHLRDIVITEYGVADLRGKTDEECIQALLNVTDSQFQVELLEKAKAAGKVGREYVIPPNYRGNTPQKIADEMRSPGCKNVFVPFPFGSDFTPDEEQIVLALQRIQGDLKTSKLKIFTAVFSFISQEKTSQVKSKLRRMNLDHPRGFTEHLYQRLLTSYLVEVSD